MKAISLWQPYASLIASGFKPFETRDWAPPRELIGQPIAIHAAKKIDRDSIDLAEALVFGQFDNQPLCACLSDRLAATMRGTPDPLMGKFGQAVLPIGCVVAIARLDAAFKLGDESDTAARPAAAVVERITSRDMPKCFTVAYDDFGDYAPGRWAWLLRDVKPITPPVAAKGKQGFFDLPQGWLAA